MSRLARRRPSPALVIALVALFVALGGTGYAAFSLPKNSVGTKQLKKNAVTGSKIKKNAVTGSKVKNDSLTGADINESTLGKVPAAASADAAASATNATNAGHAGSADSATNATHANSADSAGNADTVDSKHAADIVMWAVIDSDPAGTIGSVRDSGHFVQREKFATGGFNVIFDRDVSNCAYSVTISDPDSGDTLAGTVHAATDASNPDGVHVHTTDSAGNPADRDFMVEVFC